MRVCKCIVSIILLLFLSACATSLSGDRYSKNIMPLQTDRSTANIYVKYSEIEKGYYTQVPLEKIDEANRLVKKTMREFAVRPFLVSDKSDAEIYIDIKSSITKNLKDECIKYASLGLYPTKNYKDYYVKVKIRNSKFDEKRIEKVNINTHLFYVLAYPFNVNENKLIRNMLKDILNKAVEEKLF